MFDLCNVNETDFGFKQATIQCSNRKWVTEQLIWYCQQQLSCGWLHWHEKWSNFWSKPIIDCV